MSHRESVTSQPFAAWPFWQRIAFRFAFVYLPLQIAPWNMFAVIPGVGFLLQYWDDAMRWAVHASNTHIFQVRETLIPPNGSDDTSYAWAELWFLLTTAAIACIL